MESAPAMEPVLVLPSPPRATRSPRPSSPSPFQGNTHPYMPCPPAHSKSKHRETNKQTNKQTTARPMRTRLHANKLAHEHMTRECAPTQPPTLSQQARAELPGWQPRRQDRYFVSSHHHRLTLHNPTDSLKRNETYRSKRTKPNQTTVVLTGIFPEVGGGAGLNLGKDRARCMLESFGAKVVRWLCVRVCACARV